MKLRHLLSVCTLGICAAAFATPILDQVNNADPVYLLSPIYSSIQSNWSQSFQQSAGNISGGGFLLGAGGSGSDTFTIGVYSAEPSANPGSLLASGTATGTPGNWVDAFWNPINVAPNATLYLGITSTTSSNFTSTYTVYNSYPLGAIGIGGYVYNNYYVDLGFRTYSDDSASVSDSGSTLVM